MCAQKPPTASHHDATHSTTHSYCSPAPISTVREPTPQDERVVPRADVSGYARDRTPVASVYHGGSNSLVPHTVRVREERCPVRAFDLFFESA